MTAKRRLRPSAAQRRCDGVDSGECTISRTDLYGTSVMGLPPRFGKSVDEHGVSRQAEVHDLGAPLSPCLSRRSSSMSASAVMSASSNAPCRSSLSLLSSTSRSHIEVSDLLAPGEIAFL